MRTAAAPKPAPSPAARPVLLDSPPTDVAAGVAEVAEADAAAADSFVDPLGDAVVVVPADERAPEDEVAAA